MLKKVKELGEKVNEMNDRCRTVRVSGRAGAGMVHVEANGLSEIVNCKIDPEIFSRRDCELLEDMIITATNQALEIAREKHAEIMRNLAGTMDLPDLEGLKEAFFKEGE